MECIFETLVVSSGPTQAFCVDNNSCTRVLKVCLALSAAWDEQGSTIWAACNFPPSISASLKLHVFRGRSGALWGWIYFTLCTTLVLGSMQWHIVAHFPIIQHPPLFTLSLFLLPLQLLLFFLIDSERWKSSLNTSPFLSFFLSLIQIYFSQQHFGCTCKRPQNKYIIQNTERLSLCW